MRLAVSVKQKILLSLWLTSLLVLGLAGVVAYGWFANDQAWRLDDFLVRESRGVQDVVTSYFQLNGSPEASAQPFTSQGFLDYAAAYFRERVNRPLPYKTTLALFAADGQQVAASNAALDLSRPTVVEGTDLHLFTVAGNPEFRLAILPYVHDGKVLGSIRLACLTVALADALRGFAGSLLAILGLLFVAFGLLGTVLVHWSLRPVREMSLSARDISDSRLDRRLVVPQGRDEVSQLALILNDLLARLERDFQFEEALVGQISHELRTPLTILRARNELALERNPDSAVRNILEDNLADIDQLVSLLNTLLNLARIEGRRDLVEPQPCDLRDILPSLIEELEPLWLEKELSFQVRILGREVSWQDSPPLPVLGDPVLLRQAFLNVLTNAYKYTPRLGCIAVSIDASNPSVQEWVTVIRNPGPPIPEESLELVFKRFYRVEVQDPERYERASGLSQKGFGLGLSIAKTLVDLNGGRIRAFNPPLGGAAFEIILPRARRLEKPVRSTP